MEAICMTSSAPAHLSLSNSIQGSKNEAHLSSRQSISSRFFLTAKQPLYSVRPPRRPLSVTSMAPPKPGGKPKKVTGVIKLALEAGKATPSPPVGPALGSKGVNIMAFCKDYNARTADKAGYVIPVEITVYDDRSFTFILKTPPASVLLLKAAGNGHCDLLPISSLKSKKAAIFAAKKDYPKNKKKDDSHSFFSRPDEATGPFPEAVLLREKKVEEDGKLLPEFVDVEERELFESLMLELESDLDVENMRHYEVVYLIHEDRKDEVESVNQKVQEFIKENKGRVWRFSDWGMRRLAYKIQKAKNAHYILMNFEMEAKWINDFKSLLDKDERVIRHLVMKKDKAETEACPPPPEFQSMHAGMEDDEDDDITLEFEEYDDDEEEVEEDWEDETETEMATRSAGKQKTVV